MKTTSDINDSYLMRKNLQVECGTTRVSLENAELLIRQYGIPKRIELIMGDNNNGNYGVLAIWDYTMHLFTGFSWGYSGEGPRGLQEFFQACNVFPGYHPFTLSNTSGERIVVKNR